MNEVIIHNVNNVSHNIIFSSINFLFLYYFLFKNI